MTPSIDLTGEGKYRICVTGVGEFIGAHLAKRLKGEGHYIVGCDWKRNEHMQVGAPFILAALTESRGLRRALDFFCFTGFRPNMSTTASIFEYFCL